MTESWALNPGRRRNMQANRSRDTSPEMAVRRLLHRHGLRYFVDRKALPNLRWRADIVFPRSKIAVFIDGCYWHGCPEHFKPPTRNRDYWGPKITGNRERDAKHDQALVEAGWTVIRVWEHENPAVVADRIEAAVRGTSADPGS